MTVQTTCASLSQRCYKQNKLHHLTKRDSRLTYYFALFEALGLCLRYLTTSGAKSSRHILALRPRFLIWVMKFCVYVA